MFPARWLPAAVAGLDRLFTAEAKDAVNPQNRTIISRLDGFP